ncbi:unnamed protein product [Prorocentrum cordatum]|uniref:Uncharacterized protein n=1 Tax=Prorocentrum cordatum TaxID=2364126 RepID=A0ABN9PR79_9DINO|nr:unnamed protein product [Polarella glacialis]
MAPLSLTSIGRGEKDSEVFAPPLPPCSWVFWRHSRSLHIRSRRWQKLAAPESKGRRSRNARGASESAVRLWPGGQETHGAHLQPQYLQQQPQQPQPQPQQQAQPTVHAKARRGPSADDQGIYYFHHPSGRSTEEQPPEVARYLADGRQRPAASAGAPGQHGAHGGQMPHAPSYAPAQSYAAPKPAVVQYSTLGGAGAHYTASGGYGAAAQPYPQQPGKGKVPHLE